MYKALLNTGLIKQGLELSDDKIDLLLAYHALLVKWNKAYNLTAVRDPQEMISRHLLDSLSIIPHITGERILDVGTGPGLPGIPMSI
ncbi:MAG: class I SAM-dependent methyltransferase, partial [Bermanella sp.]